MSPRSLVLLVALLLPLPGCCSLARLFCGPDSSKWVSERYDTPTDTVATFLEAIRRDAPDVIWACLDEGFRARNRLDSMGAQIAWQKLREQNPGLHLAGYAEIPAATRMSAGQAIFDLEVEGLRMHLELAAATFREIVYLRPNAPSGEARQPVASFTPFVRIEKIAAADVDKSRLMLQPEPFVFEHDGMSAVPPEAIQRVGIVRVWKISNLRVQPAP